MKFISVTIVIAVFTMVLMGSYLILIQSFRSDTSNYRIVKEIISKQFDIVRADSLKEKLTCLTTSQNYSIVDFMKANNIDSSFEARAVLAKKININDYDGTPDENSKLIKYLISQKCQETVT